MIPMSNPSPYGDETLAGPTVKSQDIAATLPPEPPTPGAIGSSGAGVPGYEILGELGRGGMGVVYKARDVRLKRLVALKMILAGVHAGRDQLARFRAEAEAVARLHHPGIVQIYEVGEQNGLPYFSLEYCDGGSLSDRLDGTPMPAKNAALVVEQLAQAIHHAHLAGVVHRDLKPGNVLLLESEGGIGQKDRSGSGTKVRAAGQTEMQNVQKPGSTQLQPHFRPEELTTVCDHYVPKITDFGLAKQLDSEQGNTASGAIMGTPSYMAPEQAEGKSKSVGPLADVYSLGAILYECLTGRPPFRAATAMDTIMQVLNDEPVPVRQLNTRVPRDLETICLKCLHKEPARRYDSASSLADDLQRFLTGEPVLARPISTTERLWRWCRKNPGLASMAAASAVLLIGTLVSVTALYIQAEGQRRLAIANGIRADRQREQAEEARANTEEQRKLAEANAAAAKKAQTDAEESAKQAKHEQERAEKQEVRALSEAEKANRVTQFITGLFEASDPLGLGGFSFYIPKSMGEKLTAQEILRRGAEKITADKQTPPLIRAAILDTIGNVERSMGDYKTAESHISAGLKLRQETPETDPLELAQSIYNLAWLRHERGQYVEAEKLYRQALELRKKHAPKNNALIASTQFNLAWILLEMEEFVESETLMKEVIERRKIVWGEGNREVAIAQIALSAIYLDSGEPTKAFPLTAQGLKVFQDQEGDSSLGKTAALFQKAVMQSMLFKQHAEAEKTLLEALKLAKEGLGDKHPYLCFIYGQLGEVLELQRKPAEAEKWWRECMELAFVVVGPEHPKMIIPVSSVSRLLQARKKGEEAIPLFEKLLKAHRERFGNKHPFVGDVLAEYATLMWNLGKDEERDKAWDEAIEIYRAKPGTPRKQYSETLNYRGVVYTMKNKLEDGLKMFTQAVEIEKKLPKPRMYLLAQFQSNAASTRMDLNLFDATTEETIQDAVKSLEKVIRSEQGQLAHLIPMELSRFHRYHGRHRDAATAAREAAKVSGNFPMRHYEVAVELARCASLVLNSRVESPQERTRLRGEYHTEALAALKKAVERGFKDVQALKTNNVWTGLRQNQEFKDLITQLEKPKP